MRVIRASRAGFCMGVSLALEKLEKALQNPSNPYSRICTFGPIIHNPQVLAKFAERGVACVDKPEDVRPDDYLLIRAHGIPAPVETELRARCGGVDDATCPKVKRAQLAIAEATSKGEPLLLFGEAAHPEVRGLVSYATGPAFVFTDTEELKSADIKPFCHCVLAAQTTQDRETFDRLAIELLDKLPNMLILRTICDATKVRQEEAQELASRVDLMIVVGGRESGNTRRLASLARESGIPALHIECASEIELDKINPSHTVGLTAGASTPKYLVDAVEQLLLAHK